MATDRNICLDCGWEEADNVNPHRRTCPECGAPFNGRWEERVFVR